MYFLTAGVRFSPSLSELSVLSSRVVFVPCTHTHFLSDDPSSFPLYSFPLVSLSLPPSLSKWSTKWQSEGRGGKRGREGGVPMIEKIVI